MNKLTSVITSILCVFGNAAIATPRMFGPDSLLNHQYHHLKVKPSNTDPSITNWDTASQIFYDPNLKENNILLWLAGTGGTPDHNPMHFFETALAQGYRVISLSYITKPAVAQLCAGNMLRTNPDCASQFRKKRIYGDPAISFIPDEPQDAIVHRLNMLLQYLITADPSGYWDQYLEEGQIQWDKIAVAGQSQGGGMAEYLGKYENLARVISFSGGWDLSSPREIANWYFINQQTPLERWYGTYHSYEKEAILLAKSYQALKIPSKQVYTLQLPLPPGINPTSRNPYHGQGINNPAYGDIWIEMLGRGTDDN